MIAEPGTVEVRPMHHLQYYDVAASLTCPSKRRIFFNLEISKLEAPFACKAYATV